MKVIVLGTGCAKCKSLEEKIRQVAAKHNLPAEIEKVTELKEIMKYGIMMTPGLVVDGVVKCVGVIPKDEQLLAWLKGSEK